MPMPRSIKRRLERIEGQAGRRPAPAREVLDMLEEHVAAGRPFTRGQAFQYAWAEYLAARRRLEADPPAPPPTYRPGEPEEVRRRRWCAWDHPSLDNNIR